MKRLLICLAILVAVPLCSELRAQETTRLRTLPVEIPHFSFMGIDIDGGPLPFVEALKEKGFEFVNKQGNIFILTGTFSGVQGCAVGVNVKDDFVWKVSVSFPTQMSWPAMKAQYEKYKKNYISSLEKHGKARAELVEGLKSIPYLRVFPSQANFIMCEVTGGRTSLDLCAQILVNEDILIKDLSSKAGNGRQYIRIAVRDEADNARLIEALKRA